MVAVREITWEEASAPGFEQTTRQAWRAAVTAIAEKAKAKLPECSGRVDSAVKLVLAGDVTLQADGTAKVASQSNGTAAYLVGNGKCTCKDFAKAPHGLCKHRFSAAIVRRAQALLAAKVDTNGHAAADPAPVHPEAPTVLLPEVPAIVSTTITVDGRCVELKLCDTDDNRLLARLATILQRFPVMATPADTTPQCPRHGAMKPSTKGKGWYCPHKLGDGTWCKGR